MSLYDIFQSFAIFFGTWPIPKELRSLGTYGAMGNTATCNAQGFLFMLGCGTPLYNAFLGIHYVLTVRYRFTEIQMKKVERPAHVAIFAFVCSGAISAFVTKSLNPHGPFCWLGEFPDKCSRSEEVECIRGEYYARLIGLMFCTSILVLSMIVATISMVVLYATIKGAERRSARYSGGRLQSTRQRYKKSRQVSQQAIFYLLSFYVAYVPSSTTRLYKMWTGRELTGLIYVSVVLYPSQGFFNFLVYERSKRKPIRLNLIKRAGSLVLRPSLVGRLSFLNSPETGRSDPVQNQVSLTRSR